MQGSTASVSEGCAFDRLARPVQRWVRRQGWPGLREVQERAIPAVMDGGDVIISAATASGKTEAAFLPLISRILAASDKPGYRGLYVSPLKALINDQFRRLETLCDDVALPLHMRHGDVAHSAKKRANAAPAGLLLITPESLESMLMRRGSEIPRLFGSVETVVIDELHSFIGTERGVHLLSLLCRMEIGAARTIDRIGLSATLGDMSLAAAALRPGSEDRVAIVEPSTRSSGKAIDLEISVFESKLDAETDDRYSTVRRAVEALFAEFKSQPGLIFANSRNAVEEVSYRLRERCEAERIPNAFLPHHGKLAKGLREFAEAEIRNTTTPTTIVATSTLEMGVDIGSVDTVAQIEPPNSVAALRQRVGRSGRRDGQRPHLRLFITEQEPVSGGSVGDHLRLNLIQGLAVTNLLQRGWCEPPVSHGHHFSTLVHQILALITQRGGCSALGLFSDICQSGPFRSVMPDQFMAVLRNLARPELALIEQRSDGTLLLGRKGEKRIEHFTFYAVFPTPEEYRVVANGKVLGTVISGLSEFIVGDPVAMGGRRWDIQEIKVEAKTLVVVPSARRSRFRGDVSPSVHEQIAREMKAILMGGASAEDLDAEGAVLLSNARFAFKTAGLERSPIQSTGKGLDLYPWTGTRQLAALAIALNKLGVDSQVSKAHWPCVEVKNTAFAALRGALEILASAPPPAAHDFAGCLERIPLQQKFDFAVPHDLRECAYLSDEIDLTSVPRIAAQLLS